MDIIHRVLVPFELPDADPLSPVLIETLAAMEVVLLGHYGLPDQTPPSAGRNQFEDDARSELDDIARSFDGTETSVSTRLVFGKARAKTIDRVAVEEDCDVILTPGTVDEIATVFVPLRGEDNFDRILSFVAALLTATGASVTLFHGDEEPDRQPGEQILADAADRLTERGIDPDRITREVVVEGDVTRSIVDLGASCDLLVLGETEPSLRNRIFGTVPAQVTADTDDPAFVVRNVETDGE